MRIQLYKNEYKKLKKSCIDRAVHHRYNMVPQVYAVLECLFKYGNNFQVFESTGKLNVPYTSTICFRINNKEHVVGYIPKKSRTFGDLVPKGHTGIILLRNAYKRKNMTHYFVITPKTALKKIEEAFKFLTKK